MCKAGGELSEALRELGAYCGVGRRVSEAILWDAKQVAASLGYSYEHFRKEVRFWPGVPQPVDLPGHPRWRASDWREWAANLRNSSAKAA